MVFNKQGQSASRLFADPAQPDHLGPDSRHPWSRFLAKQTIFQPHPASGAGRVALVVPAPPAKTKPWRTWRRPFWVNLGLVKTCIPGVGGAGRQGSSLEGGHASRDDQAFLFRPAGLLRHGRVEPAGQPRAKRFQEQGCPRTLHPAIPPNAFVSSQKPGESCRINPELTLFVPAAAGLDLMKTYYLPTNVFD